MERETIEIPLTPNDRSLLLRYGYPFERIEKSLKACASSDDVEVIPMDSLELERLIGDVSISINQMEGGATLGQLLELCERLESADQFGDGTLDVF